MEDWNDLKLVLAVHRAGSLIAAARTLAIDHSTAFRRLKALEGGLDVRLFERLPGGVYQATPAGARMAAGAERMEDEALTLDRDIVGGDHRLSGQLRITSSETLAYSRLTGHLAAFRQAHPGIVVELLIENRVLSLSRREADIALRPVRPKEGDLWGRKLADMAWALYAAPDYLETRGLLRDAEDFGHHAVIGWETGMVGIAAADWLAANVPSASVVYRTNSLVNQSIAAKAGIGLVLLPCYLGDSQDGLARAMATPISEITGELWIVTHADLKQTARVRAFFDLVGEGLARERDLFEGRRL
ncbi:MULTISPECIES: LysR family transcriptional regulator [unclassified Beijerinckia]|uniref:LysR family transcriptional regulator n=1 Tax=unclassified Beijerinckia TaxID=2638183 RepID=UPI0008964EC7|nr:MULTISPECIES: LysR family transcriptional regulator [unclassified Beijerinckia]MDH7795446.1 DNA-binding transcriptional LysR family regulator [Beijerinckia sp. GAS462]SEC01910.1 transcriptional regulator, LysR family [Beijerinckia sp. 28-YEA-48]